MTLTRCQDHILTENIWFVWSKASYSGDKRRCHYAGRTTTTNKQLKIELLSQWKLEAEFRNSDSEYRNLCWAGVESSVKLKWDPDLELTQLD